MNNRLLSIIVSITILIGTSMSALAQKAEIKAFEKDNKTLIKQLKKDYGAKVEVKMNDDQAFYLVLTKNENKQTLIWLLDETGKDIYGQPLLQYTAFSGSRFFVYDAKIWKWGVISLSGQVILPAAYDDINYFKPQEAGTHTDKDITYYHPASEEFFKTVNKSADAPNHYKFISADGTKVMAEYDGTLDAFCGYYWKIWSGKAEDADRTGLLTLDGKRIFPEQYWLFFPGTSGFVSCIKRDVDGCKFYGGKMITPGSDATEVPAIFNMVFYDKEKGRARVRLHRGDDFIDYVPDSTYTVEYKDKGQKLFDGEQFEEVITYYEGEGYGKPWGNYYMGLAANELARKEEKKLEYCVSTLKSSNNYYLPVKNPEKYEFNSGLIASMYAQSKIYLEKYINTKDIPENDPTLIAARKLRGEVVTASNNLTKKIEEYGTALSAATGKSIERDAAIARQQAQQEAAANSLATGITNLIFGGSKK